MPSNREQTFHIWLKRHEALLYKVIHSFAQSQEDKRELFSEILYQIWLSIPNFEGRSSETTWIYRVAFNSAMSWKRRNQKQAQRWRSLDGLQSAELAIESSSPDPRLKALYSAIHKLSDSYASLIIMHLDGLSYQEMSDISGITTSHVGVKINRAKKQLADLMKGTENE
ncbi:MAG: RNA polymerase sigma factor [Opitutales bacterium]